MKLFFDTSALIKKYILEKGSDKVLELLDKADTIYVSSILEIETISTFNRLLIEKAVTANDFKILKKEFETDYQFFKTADLTDPVIQGAKQVIEKHYLKSLDSIHLACAVLLINDIDYFVTCDQKLIKSGEKEGLRIINPNN